MRLEALREGVLLALDQLRANRVRSALTILGIVVGVATVVTMSALITGIRSSVLEGVEAAGPKNFIVARFDFSAVRIAEPGGRPPWADNRPVRIEEARRIAALDEVRDAMVHIDHSARIEAGRERLEGVTVSADDAGWAQFSVGDFAAGRDFLPADVRASRPVVVLSRPLAERLFGALDPVGRTVRMNGVAFRVTGVYEVAGNIFADVVKHFAIVPYTAALKHLDANPEWIGVRVVTAAHARQDEAMDAAIATLRTGRALRPGDPNDFAIIRQEEMLRTFDRLTGVFFIVMLALSSVGLLVGGVGVIGIMTIAVTERTGEIGVRKALGATRSEILWQFLVESASLTLVGGALGLALGVGAALVVQAATPVPAAVPLWAVAAALAMAAVAGILFGLWPAWRAARLDPVVALRHE